MSTAGSKEQNPTLQYTLAKEQLQVHRRYLRVFTDASSGQTAAAYCIPELNIPVVYPVMSLYSLVNNS